MATTARQPNKRQPSSLGATLRLRYAPSKLALWLVSAALTVELTTSSNLLSALGSHYVADGGWLVEKLHPGSYLAAAAMAARLTRGFRPLRNTWSLIWDEPDLAVFLAVIVFCMTYATAITGAGNVIALMDSFLPAGMIGVALTGMTKVDAAWIKNLLRLLLLLNGCLALCEATAGNHLVPIDPGLHERDLDFRPTALYDHALTGSTATLLGLFLLPDPERRPMAAYAYGACMFAALLVFGGRVALLLAPLFMSCWYLSYLGQRVAWRRLAPSHLAPVFIAVAAGGAVVCGVMESGLGERLVAHLYWDPSARARLDQFQILAWLDGPQILFGSSRTDTLALIEPLRLEYGIDVLENFWLLMFVSLGALCFPVFVVGMLALVRSLWRHSDMPGRMMVTALLLAASASNSLGRKSTLLVLLVACVMANGARSLATRRLFSTGVFRSALSGL
jgi:hypothetical protein